MRRLMIGSLVAIVALGVSACGSSNKQDDAAAAAGEAARQAGAEAQKAGAAAQQAGDQAQRAAGAGGDVGGGAAQSFGDMAKGFEQMAKGFQQGAGGKTVEPVSFRELQALLPQVPGWTMAAPEGARMTTPVTFSQASVNYSKGEATVEATIVDSGLNQLFFAPMTMFMATGYERQTANGYEKASVVNGNPGWERWDGATKDGELNMVVGQRFLVTLKGSGIGDARALREFMNRIDAGKLAGLK